MASDPADVKHGTRNAYTNWGCRCDDCKAASAQYQREYIARRRALLDEATMREASK